MTTLKGWITTTCLVAMLMVSTMSANAGVIIGGLTSDQQPCTNTTTTKQDKVEWGIIIGGFTGIIIGGFTGIIIGGAAATEQPTVDCGIIIGGQ